MGILKKLKMDKLDVVDKLQTQASTFALEAQKMAKISSVTNRMNDLKSRRLEVYTQIGEKYCALLQAGNNVTAESSELEELLAAVKDFDDKIMAAELEIAEIESTYAKLFHDMKQSTDNAKSHKCPECGKEFEPGVNFFCGECGTDLRNIVSEQICPNCNSKFDMDTRFCRMCGTKLKKEDPPASMPAGTVK